MNLRQKKKANRNRIAKILPWIKTTKGDEKFKRLIYGEIHIPPNGKKL